MSEFMRTWWGPSIIGWSPLNSVEFYNAYLILPEQSRVYTQKLCGHGGGCERLCGRGRGCGI